MKTHILKVIFLGFIALFAFNVDASICGFTRDLGEGTRGEDVRCLQQYLSDSGFSINNYPDGVFGPRTRQSVILWQTNYGLPMFGYFDSTSRNKYSELMGGSNGWSTNVNYQVFETNNNTEYRALARINDALIMIEDAQDEIDDSNKNTNSAENSLDDAKDDILDSVIAFHVYRDFDEAYDKADDAYANAEDAFEDAGGRSRNNSNQDSAEEAIDDAQNAIDDARDEINDADDDGADVNDAENFLDDAEDSLNDAEDEFDDENYDDAEDLANDAEDLANEAIDAIDW
jgi:hypothetical protein